MKDNLVKKIEVIGIDKGTIKKLNDLDIIYVYELCALNRKKLKDDGLNLKEINDIIVKLQLMGLDLNKKYKIKNS